FVQYVVPPQLIGLSLSISLQDIVRQYILVHFQIASVSLRQTQLSMHYLILLQLDQQMDMIINQKWFYRFMKDKAYHLIQNMLEVIMESKFGLTSITICSSKS